MTLTLRRRVTLAAGLAVLLAVVATSATVYVVVRAGLRDQIDDSLRHFGSVDTAGLQHDMTAPASDLPAVAEVVLQEVGADGEVVTASGDPALPVTPAVLAVARGQRDEAFFDADVRGMPVRIFVTQVRQGTALEVGRPLTEAQAALRRLSVTLLAISFTAVAGALLVGRLVAATAVAPVHRVAEAADAVARTGELTHHIAVPTGDDLGRLASSFNMMLDALAESLARQRRLVSDASHELRTPLTTVRTNVEVLTRVDELAPDDRARLIEDTVAQLGELTGLVGDVVELARGDGEEEPFDEIDLEALTRRAAEVAGRNHPSLVFQVTGASRPVRGAPARVARAVSNLIDNAAKWSPPAGLVEIVVCDGIVSVRDHGPGVARADAPHVFDRFYRATSARSTPGSGLGLAIVKQVADSHGGAVTVSDAPGGGAVFELHLPAPTPPPGHERPRGDSHPPLRRPSR